MTPRTVLLSGASGFIGSAVRAALRAHGADITVRALSRADGPDSVRADLTDPDSLRGVAEGADVLVHLASRVSGEEEACRAVNIVGTQALMREARQAGVRRIVHLSTAAVYGLGPHRGIAVDEIGPAPVSAASRTRLAGERSALDAGAVVLRPYLITGTGDRWVVPALAELVHRVPARWDGGQARLSLVDVQDLARLIAELACGEAELASGVYHAAHPEPVRLGALLDTLAELGVIPEVPQEAWDWQRCVDRLREHPGAMSERQFELMAQEHWYRSEEIWRLANVPTGPGPLHRLTESAPWYAEHLAGKAAAGVGGG
ncbi:NAD-dependent epimerase/dehydratase family protein [Streptomyces purpurogeneiscleroticus]|uniref:NAD-dependent epimerase/dehydratase family protein n=1 Tax=Streptomyces purpurogeneiscleroticus TaxID=68259 RepID=UPI001CBDC61C|nr:NAD-dependent epimerase/dehydratase family protein [Streptomyces purpurogeneiscleroticus]MBZ4017568.1 autoregulator biosynthesis protein [Streptomyces purpurogeneiscleroticus]